MRMDINLCLYCKWFESTHEGEYGAVGEDIYSCRLCCEDEDPCTEFEESEG